MSRFAGLENSPRFSHILHRSRDAMAQNATHRIEPRTASRDSRASGSQPSTLNPQPSTLNPQPSTLNPRPSTLDHLDVLWTIPREKPRM
jgi:hypothetical protein